ncbi:MAG: YggS family pyridoxal phosphate-dependent enzyme [Muribaculaceae bacterium]
MRAIPRALADVIISLPDEVTLVAVSKFHTAEAMMEAYRAGQRDFGESRVQELLAKQALLPADIRWHFIGHVQTNKVKALVGRVSLIESVDSERLLNLIDAESERRGVVTRVLFEVHVAAEDTKTGFDPQEVLDYFSQHKYQSLKAVHICGIMGMASHTDDRERISADFRDIAAVFHKVKEMCPDLVGFDTLSMGMSDDYLLAVEAGATMVRVGSRIFGQRT